MLKSWALVLLALSLVQLPASAADMDQPYDWSGPYVGLYAGHATGNADDEFSGYLNASPWLSYVDPMAIKGNMLGALAGYNYAAGNFVLGVEADFGHANVDGSINFAGDSEKGAYITNFDMGWNGHLRARAGIAADNLLFFVAGGLAVAQADYSYNWPPNPTEIYHGHATYKGLSLGAGLDYAFSPALLLRAEYLYDNFGDHSFDFQGTGDLAYYHAIDDVSLQTHALRVALAYKF